MSPLGRPGLHWPSLSTRNTSTTSQEAQVIGFFGILVSWYAVQNCVVFYSNGYYYGFLWGLNEWIHAIQQCLLHKSQQMLAFIFIVNSLAWHSSFILLCFLINLPHFLVLNVLSHLHISLSLRWGALSPLSASWIPGWLSFKTLPCHLLSQDLWFPWLELLPVPLTPLVLGDIPGTVTMWWLVLWYLGRFSIFPNRLYISLGQRLSLADLPTRCAPNIWRVDQ